MFFIPLTILALAIGIGGVATDLSSAEDLTPQEEFVQEYGPVYPAYCENE